MEGRGVFIGGIEKWEASIGVPGTPMPAPFLFAISSSLLLGIVCMLFNKRALVCMLYNKRVLVLG